MAKYPLKVQQFNVGNDKLCQLIMNHLGVDCLAAATNHPNFMAALHADFTDCVGMMAELKNLFGKGTGRIVNSQLHSFLMLKQNNLSFPLFIEKFLEHRETTLANYGSLVHANHISIDDLVQEYSLVPLTKQCSRRSLTTTLLLILLDGGFS